MDKVRILNIDILNISQKELLEKLDEGVLLTPNIDHLVKLQGDREFYDAYRSANWIVCDSRILFRLSRLFSKPLVEAIPGSSFFTAFYLYHKNDSNCRIFLLGAAEGVANLAQQRINEIVGREIIVGSHSPSFGFENNEGECEEIIDIVNRSCATVLLVGVGAPKQEKWIAKYRKRMSGVKIFMALGATIDFEAMTLKRASTIYQKLGLEWFYRFLKEPCRLYRRYFVEDLKFFYYFFKQLIGKYTDPFSETK